MQPLALRLSSALAALLLTSALPAAAGTAKGTIVHSGKTVTVTHAYLVTGPDVFEASKTIRKLIFSADDLGAAIEKCGDLSCTDGKVMEGMTVDLDAGPRLNYWVALSGQKIQHSDTALPEELKATTDAPDHVAGQLAFDDKASGGPAVSIEFDAPLAKKFDKAN